MNDSTTGSARFSRRLWVMAAIAALAMWAATVPAVAKGAAPAVNNFNPRQGNVGTPVHVYGANFTGATSVAFDGTPVTAFTVVGPGNISTTVPSGATSGRISVTTPTGGTGTSTTDFTVTTTGGLTITSFSPNSGPIGTVVTINGTGFTGVSAVRFNGTATTGYTVLNATQISATVPGGATTGKVQVATGAGTATSTGTFTVTPRITGLTPISGTVGTAVTINGTSFLGATSVRFNGTPASFTVVNVNRVDTVVPGGATTGRVTVTTPAGTATSPTDFAVGPQTHARTISLSLGRQGSRPRLQATGGVSVSDGYAACMVYVPVVIKRWHRASWRWIATTSTLQNGRFRVRLPDRPGRYRAKAIEVTLVNGAVCLGDVSNALHHG